MSQNKQSSESLKYPQLILSGVNILPSLRLTLYTIIIKKIKKRQDSTFDCSLDNTRITKV